MGDGVARLRGEVILTTLVASVVTNLAALAVEALVQGDLCGLLGVELHLAVRTDGEPEFLRGAALAHQSQPSGFLKGFRHD